jgi:hypothetical protein
MIVRGTAATPDELTGNFGSALEDTSVGNYRSIALFAEKPLKAIFGVLQHNRARSGPAWNIVGTTRMTHFGSNVVKFTTRVFGAPTVVAHGQKNLWPMSAGVK